jgi:hypothetical protein
VLGALTPRGYRLFAANRALLSAVIPSGARRRADRRVAQRLASRLSELSPSAPAPVVDQLLG